MSATTTNGEKSNGETPKWKKTVAVGGLVVGILSLIIAMVNPRQVYVSWRNSRDKPQFEISAINTLGERNVYEVTNYLVWFKDIPTSTLQLKLGLEVSPTYLGEPLGEVQVSVKNKDDKVVAHDSWRAFDKDSKPLQLLFGPDVLASIVDAQRVPYREENGSYVYPDADLLVEVSKVSDPNHPLYTDTLKILNTPWYHFSRASPNFLDRDTQTVDIFVKGRNLGAPSEFAILAETYVITDTTGKPFNPWPKLSWDVQPVGEVERDAEFASRITLPGNKFKFEPGKCYAVKTFAVKKQNYVEFKGAGWKDSGEAWRFGDWEDLVLICFPTR